MSRTTSSTLKTAVFAQRTSEVFLFFLTMSHADITTIRVVNNYSDVSSGGNIYTGYPFTVSMPDEKEGALPRIKLTIDNVDRMLVDEIRSLSGSPDISLFLALGDSPDTVEWGPCSFKLRNVRYTSFTIQGDLKLPDIMNEAYPGRSLTSKNAPGLYQ